MAELADALDSKSSDRKIVWVRAPPPAQKKANAKKPSSRIGVRNRQRRTNDVGPLDVPANRSLVLLLSDLPAQLQECDHRQCWQRQPQRRHRVRNGCGRDARNDIVKVEERRIVLENKLELGRRAGRGQIDERKLLIRTRRIRRIEDHHAVPENLELNRAEAATIEAPAVIFPVHEETQFITCPDGGREILTERARPSSLTPRTHKGTEAARVRGVVVDAGEGSVAALGPACEIARFEAAVGDDVRYRSRGGVQSKTQKRNREETKEQMRFRFHGILRGVLSAVSRSEVNTKIKIFRKFFMYHKLLNV